MSLVLNYFNKIITWHAGMPLRKEDCNHLYPVIIYFNELMQNILFESILQRNFFTVYTLKSKLYLLIISFNFFPILQFLKEM